MHASRGNIIKNRIVSIEKRMISSINRNNEKLKIRIMTPHSIGKTREKT